VSDSCVSVYGRPSPLRPLPRVNSHCIAIGLDSVGFSCHRSLQPLYEMIWREHQLSRQNPIWRERKISDLFNSFASSSSPSQLFAVRSVVSGELRGVWCMVKPTEPTPAEIETCSWHRHSLLLALGIIHHHLLQRHHCKLLEGRARGSHFCRYLV